MPLLYMNQHIMCGTTEGTTGLIPSSEISVVAFSFIHLHYIHILISADDPGLVSGSAFLWREVEVAYSLAATTLLALRPFTREFDTGFGMGGEIFRTHRTSKAGYMISSKENSGNSRSRGGSDGIELECRNHGSSKQGLASQMEAKTTTNVSHSPRNSPSKTDEISDVDAILVTHSHPSERDTF